MDSLGGAGHPIGLALLVVLARLSPGERLAFVLHDTFGMPYDEIAGILERSPAAARQLASRARRRVRSASPLPDTDLSGQRRVVDAFLTAARDGGFDALIEVLDQDVVLLSDGGTSRPHLSRTVRGAANVAKQALTYAGLSPDVRPVLVNGAAGALVARRGQPVSLLSFTVRAGKITHIDVVADRERLRKLELPIPRD